MIVNCFQNIAEKFPTVDSYGPVTVPRSELESTAQGDMTKDQEQVDAYEQIRDLAHLTRLVTGRTGQLRMLICRAVSGRL